MSSDQPIELTDIERALAERAMRESKAKFELMFENAPHGMCLVTLDGVFLFVNPAMCRLLGYSADELLGIRVVDVTHPHDLPLTNDWLHRLGRDPLGMASFEKRYLSKQGHVVWANVNVHLHRDAFGNGTFYISYVEDITAKKAAEDALRENEEKFRIAFENAPMGMSIIRSDGSYLAVNPMLCNMFGYTREELLGGTINTITHPDDVERGNRWVRKMISGDMSEPEFEKRYIHRDGHIDWGLVRAQCVRNDDGSPRMSVVHVLDITERKRAEQALLLRDHQLREAHKIAQMADWQLSLPDLVMTWTEGMYRLLEFERASESPSLDRLLSRVHPDDLERVAGAHQAVQYQGTPCDLVHRLLMPDGRVKHVRDVFRVEHDADNKPIRISGILQDVTVMREAEEERVKLEGQLYRAQKMEAIGYLAGGIAHDFNNLLTAIGGNASLALADAGSNESLTVLLEEIIKGVESAAELTRQLLAFSRKQVILPKILNLNDTVTRLTLMLRRLLGEDLELRLALARDLGQVKMDLAQAEQILINLAVNARDAMKDGGNLTIETANVELDALDCRGHTQIEPGPFVMLAVSDNGSGMSEETKQHLFEPFFTTKEQGRGTGLGLAMVYGAVQQNHGRIEVYSEIGIGTTFRIYFPRVDEPADIAKAPPAVRSSSGNERILLVEDDPMVRSLAERVLLRHGYRVFSFANGAEALEGIAMISEAIELIITDVVMPGMNGRVFADLVKALRPSVKVLYTSGYTQNVIVHHGVLEAGIRFLAKPYSLEVLANRVREILDEVDES